MGFADFLTEAFPGVRITSGKRDPNSRLGRANPKSYHNVGMAWDVAPIEGVTFDQFRDRIGQEYDVKEAIDEVNNPSRFATGPHWHIAVGDRKGKEPVANGLSSLMQGAPMQTPDGSLAAMLQAPLTNEAIRPAPEPASNFVEMQPLPGVKPGTWDKGGRGWQIVGLIGDALQTAGGGRATYAPAMAEQQQMETMGRQKLAEQQAAQRAKQNDRLAALQDWIAQQRYRAANPDPTNAARMASEAGFQPGTPQYQQFIQQYAQRPIMIGGEAYGYGQPQTQTQTINGTTYYNINGKWYDNPEGR